MCFSACPYGQYGKNCSQECYCPKACSCHHVDGKCNSSFANTYAMQGNMPLLLVVVYLDYFMITILPKLG